MPHFDEVIPLRKLARVQGVVATVTGATLCRLSYAMMGLALMFTVQHASGSLVVAGLSSALFGLCTLSSPLKARWIDRRGHRQPFIILTFGFSGSLLCIASLEHLQVRSNLVFLTVSAIAGLLAPPVGPTVRAMLTRMSSDSWTLSRLFSFDVAIEDTMFTIGPLIVGALIASDGSAPALSICAGLTVIGAAVFAFGTPNVAHLDETHVREVPRRLRRNAPGGTLMPLGVLALTSSTVGLVDVTIVSRALHAGSPSQAGYLLGAITFGGVFGGPLWTRFAKEISQPVQHRILASVLVLTLIAAGQARSTLVVGIALFCYGATLSPLLVISYVAAQFLVPRSGATEASAWVTTAFNAGTSLGTSAGGFIASRIAPANSFLVASGVGFAALLLRFTFARHETTTLDG